MAKDSSRTGRWPNLVVVGAGRSGTSSLWHHLGGHPEMFMARMKETYYFTNSKPQF